MPKKTLGNIGARPRRPTFLRAWRKYRKLSQQAAADLIGVCYTTVGRKERGANVDQNYLEEAAKVYRCTPTEILERNPLNPKTEDVEKIIADAKAALELYLKRSVVAAREQFLVLPAQEAPPQSMPKAQPPASKLLQKPGRPKRP